MKTIALVATRDYRSNHGRFHAAGTVLATIHSDLTSGELAQQLFARTDCVLEISGSADGESPAPSSSQPDAPETDPVTAPAAEPIADDASQHVSDREESDVDETPLTDLIEPKPAKLLAAQGVRTVSDLAAWIDEGNRPRDINGIGDTTEAEILEATGCELPG